MLVAKKGRNNSGAAIAEFGAALALVIPLIVLIAYIVIESVRAYTIECSLREAADQAARRLAFAYGQNPVAVMNSPQQYFYDLGYGTVIKSDEQIEVPQGGWNTNSNPATVTVIATYKGGTNGCPAFPSPDLFHVGQLEFRASATRQLE